MKISSAFPSNYIKAADLQGRTVPVVISDVKIETLGSGQDAEQKAILYFQGKERGLVLNKTNANIISQAYGDETDDWIGMEIELYVAMVQFQSNMVEAVRVRIPRKKPAGQAPAPVITSGKQEPLKQRAEMDDDVPFAPEMRG